MLRGLFLSVPRSDSFARRPPIPLSLATPRCLRRSWAATAPAWRCCEAAARGWGWWTRARRRRLRRAAPTRPAARRAAPTPRRSRRRRTPPRRWARGGCGTRARLVRASSLLQSSFHTFQRSRFAHPSSPLPPPASVRHRLIRRRALPRRPPRRRLARRLRRLRRPVGAAPGRLPRPHRGHLHAARRGRAAVARRQRASRGGGGVQRMRRHR